MSAIQKRIALIRNVAVIAHVDHGKTTLSDSLVSKGGHLRRTEAGNACVLDTTEEEISRGITIHSTGITLDFEVPKDEPSVAADVDAGADEKTSPSTDASVKAVAAVPSAGAGGGASASASAQGEAKEADKDGDDSDTSDSSSTLADSSTLVEVYVGNLPFRCNEEEVLAAFTARGFKPASIHLRRRGFAFVRFQAAGGPTVDAVVAAFDKSPATLGDRVMSVQSRGSTSRIRLTQLCKERGWSAPRHVPLSLPASIVVPAGKHVTAVLIDIDGEVVCFQPTTQSEVDAAAASTVRLAREQAAGLALDRILASSFSASLRRERTKTEKASNDDGNDDEKAAPEPEHEPESKPADVAEPSRGLEKESKDDDAEDEADAFLRPGMSRMTVNLIDSPGHVDFSAEVSAALRLADGALTVVDAVEGFAAQTETVLRQALTERVRPVLVINKLDNAIMKQHLSPEQIYDENITSIVANFNALVESYQPPVAEVGDWRVSFAQGTVAVGSGYYGFMATLDTAVELNRRLRGTDPASTRRRFVRNERKAVCELVLAPLASTIRAATARKVDVIARRLAAMEAAPLDPKTVDDLSEKDLLRAVMQRFMPAADALVGMMHRYLPSPAAAQPYRAPYLYTGPADDAVAKSVAACDPNGPVVMFVSKLVPMEKTKGYYAFGRVFSGTVKPGAKVYVLDNADAEAALDLARRRDGAAHELAADAPSAAAAGAGGEVETEVESKSKSESEGDAADAADLVADLPTASNAGVRATVQRIVRMMASSTLSVPSAPCGSIVALVGVSKHMSKSGTITSHPGAYPVRGLNLSVSPVVRMAVRAKKPSDTHRMVEALRNVAKADTSVEYLQDPDTGEHVLAGAGELQLEVILKAVAEAAKVEVMPSEPMVSYRETVTEPSAGPYEAGSCLAKSANKLNRLYISASPLSSDLVDALEGGAMSANDKPADISHRLQREFGWSSNEARKVWAWGPLDRASASARASGSTEPPTCVLVDSSQGLTHLHTIKDSIIAAFQQVCTKGVLAGERLRGVRFDIVDAKIIPDSAHRSAAQITPAARRAMTAALAASKPALYEPLFHMEVHVPGAFVGPVFSTLARRRAVIFADETQGAASGAFVDPATARHAIHARLPVADSFGCAEELRGASSGRAFPQCRFDSWAVVPGNADASSMASSAASGGSKKRRAAATSAEDVGFSDDRAATIVGTLRRRKGMPANVPALADLCDRL